MLSDRWLSCLSITLMYCGQTVGRIQMKLGTQVGLGLGYIVLDGDPAIGSPKKGHCPQFSAHVYCAQTAAWTKMQLTMEVGLSRGHIVLDGDIAPQFSANVYCGQTAGWIKMPLGAMVGLDPGNIVLDADPAPPQGAWPLNFGLCLLWPNGWMDQDATWYESRPRPRPHCVTWRPSSPSQKGHSPQFLALVYSGQTVAHLIY